MNQLAILYNINSPEKWQNCLREFLSAVKLGRTSIDDIVAEIRGGDSLINSTLAEEYSSNLRKAVGNVFGRSDNRILYDANVTKFAYYKAAQATAKIRGAKSDDDGKAICQIYNRYQAAEYNAAVARCRTAKQWMSFDENRELFPNLRWIPSRSVSPREEHRQFWNHVWAKDDEFWTINQPGNLWGCKCDWEETDDPITTRGEVNHFRPQQGLKGNPGITHEVFSEDHSYYQSAELYDVNKFSQRVTQEKAQKINTSTKIKIDGIERDVNINIVGIRESLSKFYPPKTYILKNTIVQDLSKLGGHITYIGSSPIDLTHNRVGGRAYKAKKNAIKMHLSRLTISNQSFKIYILEYPDNKFVFYCACT